MTLDDERLAKRYVALEWSLLPILAKSKKPATRWRRRRTTAGTTEVLGWLSKGHGLGVALGPVSGGLIARDFDDESAYQRWAAAYPNLAKTLSTSRTHRGVHVFASVTSPVQSKKFGDGELRSDGTYVVVPPSTHPSGSAYRWIREPATENLLSVKLADTGFDTDWTADNGDAPSPRPVTESAEDPEKAQAMACVNSVLSVTGDQHEAVLRAVEQTVPAGVGGRNNGIFRFARKLLAILRAKPSNEIAEKYGMIWYEAAKGTIATLDPGVTIADLKHALSRVKKPDDGSDLLETAMRRAIKRPSPSFVAKFPEETACVRLAKLVVELDAMNDHGPFFLSCHRAGALVGLPPRQANRLLMAWVEDGILRLVERGTPGPPGSKAHRYQLIER